MIFIEKLLNDQNFLKSIDKNKEKVMPYIETYIKKIKNYQKKYQIVTDESQYSTGSKGKWLYFKITTQKDKESNYKTRNFGKYDLTNNEYIRGTKEYDLNKELQQPK